MAVKKVIVANPSQPNGKSYPHLLKRLKSIETQASKKQAELNRLEDRWEETRDELQEKFGEVIHYTFGDLLA